MLQRGNTLETGQRVGVAASDDLLAGELLGNGLNTDTAGEDQDHVSSLDGSSVLSQADIQVLGIADVIGGEENLKLRLSKRAAAIEAADTILVLSCGVGVQTVAAQYPAKRVNAGCDTYRLPGFQGVTPLEHDCRQCGQCYLNITGGICPITACSKSLVNGQCGGAKNGKCEVDPNMDCGWERIQKKLTQLGRLDALKCPVQLRDYSTDE